MVIKGTSSYPTADWMCEEIRKEIPNISLGTVYRNLRILRESANISEVCYGDTFNRFDGNTGNHYHFRCEKCGCVFDVDEAIDEELDERIALKTGFKISCHWLEFHELCK